MVLDASSRETLARGLEVRVLARAQVIHQYAHLDAALLGALHGGKNGLGFLIATQREVFNMDVPLGAVDIPGDTLENPRVVREEFDGIPA